jgi:D-alanyl-D-alanine carboxypeptidase
MRNSIRKMALAVLVTVALVATATSVGAASSGQSDPPYARALQPELEELAGELLVPGAVVLVRSKQLGNWSTTMGTRAIDEDEPVRLADHVRIGSNTKTMTGTVILQLVEEGELSLDDPVSTYRPDVPNGENITIEQLMDMRSGLYNYSESLELNESLDNTPDRAWTPEELLAISFANPPYFAPGEDFHYSNTNYVLLGLIIEQLTGDPLDVAFQERIFEPLELENTSLPESTSNAIPRRHPQGYQFGTNVETLESQVLPPDQQAAAEAGTLEPIVVTDENPSWAWAAGGGISTARDLARYVKALVRGGLLDDQLQEERLDSIQPIDPDEPSSPGYGLALAEFGPMLGHTGELPGYQSFIGYDPDRKITVVVWANLSAAPDGRAPATEMAKLIIGELYPAATPEAHDENP